MIFMNRAVMFLIVAMVLVAGCAKYNETQVTSDQQTVETPLDEEFEGLADASNDTDDLADLEDDLAAIENI